MSRREEIIRVSLLRVTLNKSTILIVFYPNFIIIYLTNMLIITKEILFVSDGEYYEKRHKKIWACPNYMRNIKYKIMRSLQWKRLQTKTQTSIIPRTLFVWNHIWLLHRHRLLRHHYEKNLHNYKQFKLIQQLHYALCSSHGSKRMRAGYKMFIKSCHSQRWWLKSSFSRNKFHLH